jgi:putative flippase GtrA
VNGSVVHATYLTPIAVRRVCRMRSVVEKLAELRATRSALIGRVARYSVGSVVATVCSQVTFLVLYGPVGASTTVTSTLAWLAGAIPNYWLNRAWTWGRSGRPSMTRELLPYAGVILGTLGLAIVATGLGAAALDRTSISHATQTLLVWGIYFFVYVVMFAFRFLVFDRLFNRGETTPRAGSEGP